jgi:hypothetical protein
VFGGPERLQARLVKHKVDEILVLANFQRSAGSRLTTGVLDDHFYFSPSSFIDRHDRFPGPHKASFTTGPQYPVAGHPIL